MSSQNVSGSAHNAVSEQQSTGEAPQHATATAYQATYYHHEENRVPGVYIIEFYPKHTLEKHFAFLGRKFVVTTLNEGYFADLDDELFNAIRRDPGVEYMEDNTSGERDG